MHSAYSTHFALTENPMAEIGTWINGKTTGLDWNNVRTANGSAFGASTGSLTYNDPTAILTGSWGASQTVAATVFANNRQTASNFYGEVELRLRSSLTAHNCTGYEINFSVINSSAAYVQIVRWNGPLGNFTYVATTSGSRCILKTGDTISATIAGSTITAYINGVQICQGTDRTYPSGNPGMGFYYQGTTGSIADYGFTSYTASDGTGVPVITASSLTGTSGHAISYPIVASNSPTSYTATGLPAGLSLSNGVISGTPNVSGTFASALSASNSTGTGKSVLSMIIRSSLTPSPSPTPSPTPSQTPLPTPLQQTTPAPPSNLQIIQTGT